MKRMVRLLPLLASTFLLAGILSAAGPVEPDEAGDGTRMYRGQWRNLAKEAAAMRMRAGNAKDEVERFHAFHQLAFLESDRQQWVPMRAAAEIATAIGDAWFAGDMRPPDISYRQRIFHLECRGLVEKGLVIEGRLAEARAELQRMRLDLIKLHVAEHGGTAESVAALTELDLWKRHSLFMLWQIIGSEAFHLEREGRTNEAVQVLRTAVDAARNSRTGDEIDGFYEIQLAPELAGRLFDLGYVAQGIAVLEEFVREWDGDKDHFAEQYWGARIQLPMFRAELEGPSEALVREAEDAHQRRAAAFGGGRDHWGEEVLAGMRHRLKKSPETEAALRQLSAKMNSHGEGLESLSVRTEALAIGNESPQPGRDQEFIDLLMDHRRVGDKSREPGLYKSYGDYLLKTGRPAEALAVYREALRQVVSFDWRVQEPRYRLDVIAALTRLGELAAADTALAKLDRSITAIPDFPPERALEVKVARIQWLAQRGKLAEARTALEGAQSFAGAAQINAWQRRNLDALKLEAGNAAIPEAAPEPVPNTDQLQRSPFLPISFTHRVVPRDGEAGLVNIRFTASAPARLECYDAVTGRLLAIDANGNGRFTDPGDVLPEDADGNRALDLAFEDTRKIREVEVFVFPTATGISPGKVHVDVDLLTTAGWERSARHELE